MPILARLGSSCPGLLLTNVLICCAMVHRIKKVEATLPVEYLQRVGYLQVRCEGEKQQQKEAHVNGVHCCLLARQYGLLCR